MAFLFDWAFFGSASGSTVINDGANGTTFTSTPVRTGGTSAITTYDPGNGGTLNINGVPSGESSGVRLDFTTAVKELSFEIIDLDAAAGSWDDQVSVFGINADGDQVPITFSNLEAYHAQTGPNTVEANGNSSTAYDPPGSADSINVTISEPVVQVFILFQGGSSGLSTAVIGLDDLTGSVVCFDADTRIATDGGEKPVLHLEVGDTVRTLDHGSQVIRWIGHRTVESAELARHPHLRPIRIRAGALADGVPSRDLIVSPQHRILVRSKIAIRMFASEEVFAPAKHLLGLPGVEVAEDIDAVTYVHLMCDDHEIVEADGAFAETLHTGPEAMKALTPAAKREIAQIFGAAPDATRPLARPAPPGRLAKKLVARHIKNHKSLYRNA